jgi:hypothetical protein
VASASRGPGEGWRAHAADAIAIGTLTGPSAADFALDVSHTLPIIASLSANALAATIVGATKLARPFTPVSRSRVPVPITLFRREFDPRHRNGSMHLAFTPQLIKGDHHERNRPRRL